ncbi:hypothetical protein DSL72_002438 [Monilinia vaccinii-corymbosi]|uniref:CsbD-like domain-containing protein n=1 Tax=Monilinia vaccinii-corymbosi TaxID=61207 RepID=A0A8A3PCP7_9HELO|nr:hypothetical protein DSL72_002438 [Monilinia vaccinii-corymbosi]
MSDKDTSTLQSYIDSAAGAAQSVLGAITGSTADKESGAEKSHQATLKNEASHAGASLGGYSVSSSGAVAENDPARQQGAWNQTVGSGKEFVGGVLGSEGLKREGREQNAEGRGQQAQGQVRDLGTGVKDRVQGFVGAAVAGGEEERQRRRDQHDVGKSLQRGVESELTKEE